MNVRWHMQNTRKGIMMEAPGNKVGKIELERRRSTAPNLWKGARIIKVIQAYPSKIKMLKIYKLT